MRPGPLLASAAALLLCAAPAAAHPHVWITSKAVILYGPDGKVTGIRHGWTFDEAYSAFAVQGFETDADGKPRADKMAELAKVNVESLAESGFFTQAKANGVKQAFGEPASYGTTYDKGRLTLTFDLPLKAPAKADRAFTLDVYDPTFFVDFALAPGEDAVKLEGAPQGCALKVTRPKESAPAPGGQGVSEAFFSALGAAANYGAQFSSRILVACP